MSHHGHTSVSVSRNTADDYRLLPAVHDSRKSRIEAELGARLGDRDRAVIVGDIVDARRAAGDRQQCRLRGGIDMQARRARRPLVPGARPVEQAVAQHDRLHAGAPSTCRSMSAAPFDGHRARRVVEIERISLGMRLAARRIRKRDALHDERARAGGLRGGDQVAGALDADTGIGRIGGRDLRLVEFTRQIGELMDDDLGTRRRAPPRSPPRRRTRRRTAGAAPARSISPAFAAERVVPVTSWPHQTSSGVSRRPMAPAAPARNMRMV